MLAADKDEIMGNGVSQEQITATATPTEKIEEARARKEQQPEKRRHDVPIQRPRDNTQ